MNTESLLIELRFPKYPHSTGLLDRAADAIQLLQVELDGAKRCDELNEKIYYELRARLDAYSRAIAQCRGINPYRQPGNRESYLKYSEGWNDAVDYIESVISAKRGNETTCCQTEDELHRLREENIKLSAQLASQIEYTLEWQGKALESQRREQAAADLINRLGKDINTISRATEYIKPGTGVWHTLGIMFQAIENWRGQGKGDTSQCKPTAQ